MPGRLYEQIKQTRPFDSPALEAYINVLRTAEMLSRREMTLLKANGLSSTQYNALRILRGAGPEGLACHEVANRMITRDPDITRLLDRLEARGLVVRVRASTDRRVVHARITPAGLDQIAPLDAPVHALHLEQLGHMGPERLRQLIELLEVAREKLE